MGEVLNESQVAAYRRDGFHFPVDVLAADEVAGLRARLEAFETVQGAPLHGTQRVRTNLLFRWMDELMRDPRLLDPVADLIGPDILSWGCHMFVKEAETPDFVSWHQDHQYWGLDSPDVVTAWLALSPSTVESGCMRMMPGSQDVDLRHEDTFDPQNMLTRGQRIVEGIDEARAVDLVLRPGQMSLHNVQIAHASDPNRTTDRRIGIAFRFMPARTRQVVGEWDSALLVRGEDRYGHFLPEPRPRFDLDPETVAFHKTTLQNQIGFLYAGADRPRDEFAAAS